jgi:Txe/YoeB family toxin of toxin-antitoxin system
MRMVETITPEERSAPQELEKDHAGKIARSRLKPAAEKLLAILKRNPYQSSPPYEKLVGDLSGACSRRINIQHRLVYQVFAEVKTVKVSQMWRHYE